MSAGYTFPLGSQAHPSTVGTLNLDMGTARGSLSLHQQKSSKRKETPRHNSQSPRSSHKRSVRGCAVYSRWCICRRGQPCCCSLYTKTHAYLDFLQEESKSKAGSLPLRWRAVAETGWKEPVLCWPRAWEPAGKPAFLRRDNLAAEPPAP